MLMITNKIMIKVYMVHCENHSIPLDTIQEEIHKIPPIPKLLYWIEVGKAAN